MSISRATLSRLAKSWSAMGVRVCFSETYAVPLAGLSPQLHSSHLYKASHGFHTTPAVLGVMNSMKSAYDTALSNTETKREAKVFAAQMKFLCDERRIDGDVFLELMGTLREASGMGGLKEHLPWVQNNPAMGEFKRQEAIVRALTPAERRDAFSVGISAKKRVAASTGEQLHTVESVLSQIRTLIGIQKWMRKRISDGLPVPESNAEMQSMMMGPGSGLSRRAPKGRRMSPGVKGGTARR